MFFIAVSFFQCKKASSGCFYHFIHMLSESTLYNCLNVKELRARNRWDIWKLTDYNGTRANNHFFQKQILKHLTDYWAVLSELIRMVHWLCIFIMWHTRLGWIYSLQLSEFQAPPCSKQAQYLKNTWLQRNSNPQQLVCERALHQIPRLVKWSNFLVRTCPYFILCFYFKKHLSVLVHYSTYVRWQKHTVNVPYR